MGNRTNIPGTETKNAHTVLQLTCPRDDKAMFLYREELAIYYYVCTECCLMIWLSHDNHTYDAAWQKLAKRAEELKR